MIIQQQVSATKRFILYAITVLIIFCLIFWKFADELIEKELYQFDMNIINIIQGLISERNTEIMKAFTFLGSSKSIILISIITIMLMIIYKKRWEVFFFILAIIGSALFNLLLKWIFHRARPVIHPIIQEKGYSFPSGHAMMSFVLYGMLTYFLILFYEKKTAKIMTFIMFFILVLFIGISRIYLGVHYPSDVLAGYSAGGAWLTMCLILLKLIVEKRDKRQTL
ncbi:phosphatase PAP2 family protein [Bacillus sp. S/N-304-OC-R1]|uniref:phosphatase PAP2 family protein n=1 Tax=Bacillus sp. S/N-304-OC-R1 TaxID=2758034 RepID=UPI001C8DC5C1|nr:phosphatase PAP2 family protein [Bacillus sp. S/N-304-OC-R1]MBY0124080.1 phosphatase PAP2 family protein [Bacillus sp. S/N-304-OC-R1]